MAVDTARARPFGLYERLLALRYLRAKRQQGGVGMMAVISFLGIMAAVFVLIVTMSIMNGFRETLLSRILGVSGHVLVDVRGRTPGEIDEIANLVRTAPQVLTVAPVIQGQAMATLGPVATGALVNGMRAEDLRALELVSNGIVAGSLSGFEGGEEDEPKLVMGKVLAEQLGLGAGDAVSLIAPQGVATPFGYAPRRKTYEIGALFDAGYYEVNAAVIYMPLNEARLFFGHEDGADRLELRVVDPDRTHVVMQELRRRLGPDLFILDWKAQNQSLVTALIVERNVMRLILMMLVAIAALNIISGLVMLVKNKARDVAILRTMGASQGSILRVFLMAGGALGAGGAATGVILAVLFCLNIGPIQGAIEAITGTRVFDPSVYSLSRVPASLEFGEVAGVTFFAVAMSFLAALIPAWSASRLDPVEALRYE